MSLSVRRLALTGALASALLAPAPALAQEGMPNLPWVSGDPPPSWTADTRATPSAAPGRQLPNTGSDAQTYALAGVSLLLLGTSLRLQLSLGRGRD